MGKTNKTNPNQKPSKKLYFSFWVIYFSWALGEKDSNLLTTLIKASQDCSIKQVGVSLFPVEPRYPLLGTPESGPSDTMSESS